MPRLAKSLDQRTLLIFPPVWTPITPYLALPLLVAYLKQEGFFVRQYDASLHFFARHLLTPNTLFHLIDIIAERKKNGDYNAAEEHKKALAEDVIQNPQKWLEKIKGVGACLMILREEASFFQPERCIQAQSDLYLLLELASLAYYPSSFTFNTFSTPSPKDFPGLARFCEDSTTNPFLTYFEDTIPSLLANERPSLVGLSISTSHQLFGALTLARFIKSRYPTIHITLGGRHILRLRESLAERPTFFSQFTDSMVIDNGERPLKQLICQLDRGGSHSEVPNLVYYEDDTLHFNKIGPHEPIANLPAPDFDDLPLREYLSPTPIMPVRLSEGCYWGKCTFCSRYDNKKFQTIPAEQAVQQMEYLQKRHDVSCFTVNDDCLTPTYLEAFARLILQRGLRFQISLWCKPVGSFTRDRLRLLSQAGVRLVRWGLESGHPRVLKRMNKGTRVGETLKVLADADASGIWNHATIILGFPTETESEANETMRFLETHQNVIHSSILFRFVLLNHSYIMKNPAEFSIRSITQKDDLFSYALTFDGSRGMNSKELSSFLTWAQRYRIESLYGYPFWFFLRIREYLLLYVHKYGLKEIKKLKVRPDTFAVYRVGEQIRYSFRKPDEISSDRLSGIVALIKAGREVGDSWIENNLKRAHLIGYATEQGMLVGTMTLKNPLRAYVKEIGAKTQLQLSGYLERGYSSIRPEYRGLGVGDALLKGLLKRCPDRNIYVTIRLDNLPAIRLTQKNHMKLAATYFNEKTGHNVGVYVSR